MEKKKKKNEWLIMKVIRPRTFEKDFSFILIFINITIVTVLIENIRDKRPYNK